MDTGGERMTTLEDCTVIESHLISIENAIDLVRERLNRIKDREQK